MSHKSTHHKSPPVWEVVSFPASDTYLQDPGTYQPALDFISQHTPYPMFTGLQIEEPSNRLSQFYGWESLERHIAFSKEPIHDQLAPLATPCVAGAPEIKHIAFNSKGEELIAFRAPVMEFVWMTPKTDVSQHDFQKAVKHYTELFQKNKRCLGAAWGTILEPEESKNMAIYVAGWNSKEERDEVVQSLAEQIDSCCHGVKAVDGKHAKSFKDVSDLEVVHLKLTPGRRDA